eukprot:CAMPEP_0168320554 /NCGR_PEP_ID=MMETSP0213-20121227/1743_1 /TAXON_ID=151035 /ORGANISM="Euplotes harpa, Strain FSP1.4" /LENGTH=79 /DNA_ID=CAMNT_0008322033 /DNA_START=13 /DNA_END=252 /DNA_ORIENTATION=-
MANFVRKIRKIKTEEEKLSVVELDSEDMNLSYMRSVSSLSNEEPAIVLSMQKPSRQQSYLPDFGSKLREGKSRRRGLRK